MCTEGSNCPYQGLINDDNRCKNCPYWEETGGRRMNELKSCPFCGGTNLHLESFSGWGTDVIVCYNCLATFSQQEITCEEDLVEAWNRRTSDERTD